MTTNTLALAILLLCNCLHAETTYLVTVVATNSTGTNLALSAFDYVELIGYSTAFPPVLYATMSGGTIIPFYPTANSNNQAIKATGITNISLQEFGSANVWATFKITSPQTNMLPMIPANAVVIPADTNGPVTIILESSTDLVNWTAAMPGTYGTTSTNRFFRVRAIR